MLTSPDLSDVIKSDANAGGSFHATCELIYQPAGKEGCWKQLPRIKVLGSQMTNI